LRAELERVATARALSDSTTLAQAELARDQRRLAETQRLELERSLQEVARARDARRDALAIELREAGELQDRIRRLLEAMRRIP
jgi:hypothetical protein